MLTKIDYIVKGINLSMPLYQILYTGEDNQFYSPSRGYHKLFGVWLKADKLPLPCHDKPVFYNSGFHCFVNLKDAIKIVNQIDAQRRAFVVSVWGKNIQLFGYQYNGISIAVADYIKILCIKFKPKSKV